MPEKNNLLKRIWSWLKWILFVAGSILLGIGIYRTAGSIGKTKSRTSWAKIPGTKKAVLVKDENGTAVRVELPFSEELDRQVEADDIKTIGLTENKEVKIEIKHVPTDRRIDGYSDSDMSI